MRKTATVILTTAVIAGGALTAFAYDNARTGPFEGTTVFKHCGDSPSDIDNSEVLEFVRFQDGRIVLRCR